MLYSVFAVLYHISPDWRKKTLQYKCGGDTTRTDLIISNIISSVYIINLYYKSGTPSSHRTSYNSNIKILYKYNPWILFLSKLSKNTSICAQDTDTVRICAFAEMPCLAEFPTGDQLGWNKVISTTVLSVPKDLKQNTLGVLVSHEFLFGNSVLKTKN